MKAGQSIRLNIKLTLGDQGQTQPLQTYAFTPQGKLLDSAPLEQGNATINMPAELNGHMLEVIVGPRVEKGLPTPTSAALKRMGSHVHVTRLLKKDPVLQLQLPRWTFPLWRFCLVRGRLVKRFTLPDGSPRELPVCHARVHICEVDRRIQLRSATPDPSRASQVQ